MLGLPTLFLKQCSPGNEIILEERLGNEGRSGVVYKATSNAFAGGKEFFAVKVYSQEVDSGTRKIIKSLIENRSLQSQPSLHLPKIVVVDEKNIFRGYAMSYADNFIELETFYTSTGRNDEKYTVSFAIQLCRAVQSIHEQGFLISDLSGSNILVNEDGHLIIIDCDSFGTAENLPPFQPPVDFICPEPFSGRKSDLFIVGIHLANLLYGLHPFNGIRENVDFPTVEENIQQGVSWLWNPECRIPKNAHLNNVPEDIKKEILKLLDYNLETRQDSLTPMIKQLLSYKEKIGLNNVAINESDFIAEKEEIKQEKGEVMAIMVPYIVLFLVDFFSRIVWQSYPAGNLLYFSGFLLRAISAVWIIAILKMGCNNFSKSIVIYMESLMAISFLAALAIESELIQGILILLNLGFHLFCIHELVEKRKRRA